MSWARLSAHADRAALDFMGGVSVIAGAVTGRGFLEENKELVFDDGVEIVPWLLKIRTAEFGHLDYNHSLVVDGMAFKATRPPEPLPGSEPRALSWSMVRLARTTAVAIPLVSRLLRTGSGQLLVTGSGRSLQTQPS
jgi:hypothetical protein